MFIHQTRSNRPSYIYQHQDYLVQTPHNTTIVPPSNKRIDIIDVDGRGTVPTVVTLVILVTIFFLVCIWNGYRLWNRRSTKPCHFTITSTDAYTDARDNYENVESIFGALSAMGDNHVPRLVVENVELQAFSGAGQRA